MEDFLIECPECSETISLIREDPNTAASITEFLLESENGPGCVRKNEQEIRDLAELAYAQDPKQTEYLLTKLGLQKVLRSVEFLSRNG